MHKPKDYPAKIEAAELEILELSEALDSRKQTLQELEDELFERVFTAEDTQGKKLFSNDTARAAALRKLKAEDSTYQAMESTIKVLERTKAKTGFTLERLRNEFSVAKLETREVIAVAAQNRHFARPLIIHEKTNNHEHKQSTKPAA